MPLHHRQSGSTGRAGQPAMSEAALIASLKEENERLREHYDRATLKLAEANKALNDLKVQAQTFKDDNAALRHENNTLAFDKTSMEHKHQELQAKYENLGLRYNALRGPSPTNPMAGPLPDRTKKPSKKDREHRDDRGDRERGRGREKDKEDPQADKVRLSQRFETRRPPAARRHIEGWGPGPGGRSASATPANRNTNTISTGRNRETIYAPNHGPTSPRTPRTTGFPMSPTSPISSAFNSSGSSTTFDDNYEDGNYHQYPVHR